MELPSLASKRARLQTEPPCKNTKDLTAACSCPFHTRGPLAAIDPSLIPEAHKRSRRRNIMGTKSAVGLQRIDVLSHAPLEVDTVEGELKLLKFMDLLDFISYRTPYSSAHFDVNQSVLTKLVVNHLPLIVGKEAAARNTQRLVAVVSAKQLKPASLIWVTNRQQGKTTTIAKFLAALLLASPLGMCSREACVSLRSLEAPKVVTWSLFIQQVSIGPKRFVRARQEAVKCAYKDCVGAESSETVHLLHCHKWWTVGKPKV